MSFQILSKYPIVLLCLAIIALQWVLVKKFDLSPWKGGGFGMFSTVDAHGARAIQLEIFDSSGQVFRPKIPEILKDHGLELRSYPSDRNFSQFFDKALRLGWYIVPDEKCVSAEAGKCLVGAAAPPRESGRRIKVEKIGAKIYRPKFDKNSKSLTFTPLKARLWKVPNERD